MTIRTPFSDVNVGEYFVFLDKATEPKTPEGLDGDIWTKVSFHKIRKFGEQKTSAVVFKKGSVHVSIVAKNSDELIAKNPLWRGK